LISPFVKEWAPEIRTLYRSNPLQSEDLIAQYLEERLQRFSFSEKRNLLEKLTEEFEPSRSDVKPVLDREGEPFAELCSLLLGERISVEDLKSEALVGKLASSLNTVFDTLNQIVGVIHGTLLGAKGELETIRQIIGADIQGGREGNSLQTYLDQIQEAFQVAHQAFQQAARIKVGEILSELDPERIATLTGGGFKFGPMRKAELFEIYREKFYTCKGSFESGRLMNDLLREFEKICQKVYKMKTREVQ
jgi:hypothetical protein